MVKLIQQQNGQECCEKRKLMGLVAQANLSMISPLPEDMFEHFAERSEYKQLLSGEEVVIIRPLHGRVYAIGCYLRFSVDVRGLPHLIAIVRRQEVVPCRPRRRESCILTVQAIGLAPEE